MKQEIPDLVMSKAEAAVDWLEQTFGIGTRDAELMHYGLDRHVDGFERIPELVNQYGLKNVSIINADKRRAGVQDKFILLRPNNGLPARTISPGDDGDDVRMIELKRGNYLWDDESSVVLSTVAHVCSDYACVPSALWSGVHSGGKPFGSIVKDLKRVNYHLHRNDGDSLSQQITPTRFTPDETLREYLRMSGYRIFDMPRAGGVEKNAYGVFKTFGDTPGAIVKVGKDNSTKKHVFHLMDGKPVEPAVSYGNMYDRGDGGYDHFDYVAVPWWKGGIPRHLNRHDDNIHFGYF